MRPAAVVPLLPVVAAMRAARATRRRTRRAGQRGSAGVTATLRSARNSEAPIDEEYVLKLLATPDLLNPTKMTADENRLFERLVVQLQLQLKALTGPPTPSTPSSAVRAVASCSNHGCSARAVASIFSHKQMSGRALDAKRTATLSVWVAGGLSVAIYALASVFASSKVLTYAGDDGETPSESLL
jgi:hypothetical protein